MTLNYFEDRKRFESGSQSVTDCINIIFKRVTDTAGINAYLAVAEKESLLKAAAVADERFRRGVPRPLEGMMVAIKDNISVVGFPLTCASAILENFRPLYNATVVDRLLNAGAVIVGKTNMDEFAMGSSNENSFRGPVLNPISQDRVPGGSSGGSAAALAAGTCHVALGSDTGGSVRQPAAFCGVYGFKPTYGIVSRSGLTAFASSLDQIGVFGNTVEDVTDVMSCIAGHDKADATSLNTTISFTSSSLPEQIVIGTLAEEQLEGCQPEVIEAYRNTISILRDKGAATRDIVLPYKDLWVPTYFILATAEASSNLARFDGVRYGIRRNADDLVASSRSHGFGAEVRRRIMLGTYVLSAGHYSSYYGKAQKARVAITDAYREVFTECCALLLPTTPTTAFRQGEKNDPVSMWLSDLFTVSANIAGIPAISFPAGYDNVGLPIGLQLQGPLEADGELLALTRWLRS